MKDIPAKDLVKGIQFLSEKGVTQTLMGRITGERNYYVTRLKQKSPNYTSERINNFVTYICNELEITKEEFISGDYELEIKKKGLKVDAPKGAITTSELQKLTKISEVLGGELNPDLITLLRPYLSN